jgi:septal ring factor EnvC (AmiA/AmiB activator)
MLDMNFFKNKIKKFQEKKLDEILFKIQFHESTKKKLEEEIEKTNKEDKKLTKNIAYHSQMVEIWRENEKKLRKQMTGNS